jgi:prepilin-type N-terminal cleavage/methylation domain-containing protein
MATERGFTLVELMMVVAVMGVLSSVAIPEFNKSQLRARSAERRMIMTSIAHVASDVMVTQARLPGGSLLGDWNPSAMPSPSKHPFDAAQAGWDQLPLSIEGSLYYSYKFLISDAGGPTTLDVWAAGDLDGDGEESTKQMSYVGMDNAFGTPVETPPPGSEDVGTF